MLSRTDQYSEEIWCKLRRFNNLRSAKCYAAIHHILWTMIARQPSSHRNAPTVSFNWYPNFLLSLQCSEVKYCFNRARSTFHRSSKHRGTSIWKQLTLCFVRCVDNISSTVQKDEMDVERQTSYLHRSCINVCSKIPFLDPEQLQTMPC